MLLLVLISSCTSFATAQGGLKTNHHTSSQAISFPFHSTSKGTILFPFHSSPTTILIIPFRFHSKVPRKAEWLRNHSNSGVAIPQPWYGRPVAIPYLLFYTTKQICYWNQGVKSFLHCYGYETCSLMQPQCCAGMCCSFLLLVFFLPGWKTYNLKSLGPHRISCVRYSARVKFSGRRRGACHFSSPASSKCDTTSMLPGMCGLGNCTQTTCERRQIHGYLWSSTCAISGFVQAWNRSR